MKQLIATSIGEEPVSFEDHLCDDGLGYGPYRIRCTMWREGDRVVLDFAGTDPQSSASINFFLNENMFRMFFGIYMIMVFDPQILFNDGFYDLIDVRIPAGSLLKPKFPAALSGRTHALGRIFDILGGLLGQKTPEFLNAAGFSSSPHLFYSGVDTRRAATSSCSRSGSAGFRGGRSATGRTATRSGPGSPTSRTSSSNAIFRCGSSVTRPSRTRAAPGSTAAATAST